MQRFFEFFRRKNYGALWSNLLNRFYLSNFQEKNPLPFSRNILYLKQKKLHLQTFFLNLE
ncbi:MAG: hypothetical protein ACI9XO_004695 [Paraglaciecola sp.]|jgi:hypothetical protein